MTSAYGTRLIEQLEPRRLMSAGVLLQTEVHNPPRAATVDVRHLMRAQPAANYVGNYAGTVKLKGSSAVAFSFLISNIDPSSHFIIGAIAFVPAGRIPFDGTYTVKNGGVAYSAAKPTASLSLTGKLARSGNVLTGKFTLNESGTKYVGTYKVTRQ